MEITNETAYKEYAKKLVGYAKIDLPTIETDSLKLPEYIVEAGYFLGNMERDYGRVCDALTILESEKRKELRDKAKSLGERVTETGLQDCVNIDPEIMELMELKRETEKRLEIAKALFMAIATAKRKVVERQIERTSYLTKIEQD